MQEQLGKEPDPNKCPPGGEDFPETILIAVNIFETLGNRIYPDIGHIGKDYTNLPILLDLYGVDNVELVLEALSRLDSHAVKQSQDRLKRERKKLESKK